MPKKLVVVLASGEEIDLSGLPPADVVAALRDRGVTAADIRETRHYIDPAAIGSAR
jgi:hypothetical protein